MNKTLSGIILIGLCFFCFACQQDKAGMEGSPGKKFTLEKGRQIHFKQQNITIRFIGVPNDNRCTGVCAWEGSADVELEITDNHEKTEKLILNTTDQRGYSTSKSFERFKIQLIHLDSRGYIFTEYRPTLLVAAGGQTFHQSEPTGEQR